MKTPSFRRAASAARTRKTFASIEPLEGRTLLSGNLTIKPTFDSSITQLSDFAAIESSINAAIANVEAQVTSNSPVSVSIDFKGTSSGLADSVTPQADMSYSTYLADLRRIPVSRRTT